MARKLKFFGVDSAPSVWTPDSVYIIQDGDYAEGWVTDKMGVPKELGNSIMINELIAAATIGVDIIIVNVTAAIYNLILVSGVIVLLCDTTSNSITINLPTAIGNKSTINIKKVNIGSNNITIDGNGSQTIDGGLTATIKRQYSSIELVSDNINWQII